MTTIDDARAGILSRPYALTTLGSWSLIFLAAFESLAVTTIMPIVASDLDGRALYSLAFSATIAAGIVGMVVIGAWADRRGPAVSLLTAIGLFAAGLIIAGTATSMGIFVAGRFVQGLGAGGQTVALYVLIAKVYPPATHIRIFGAYASAWVLPSLVGPVLAGLVADALNWRWVFLGVVLLVIAATAMVVPALRGLAPAEFRGEALDARRIVAAVVVAAAAVVLSSSTDWEQGVAWLFAPVSIAVIGFAAKRLIPPGTYRARPGLPAVVLLCAAAGAVFFGTEVFLPLMLHDRYGWPTWLSGVTLTAAAVSWAIASAVQGRLGDRLAVPTAMRAGALMLAGGTIVVLLTIALGVPAWVAAVGWFVSGAGMGTLYPRVSTLVLAFSEEGRAGFNTAAKSIADSVGASVSLAVAGLVFAALGDSAARLPYVGVLILTSAIAITVVMISARVVPASSRRNRREAGRGQ